MKKLFKKEPEKSDKPVEKPVDKYTLEEWAFFQEIEAQKDVQRKLQDKIHKANAKRYDKTVSKFPRNSIVEVCGVQGVVISFDQESTDNGESCHYFDHWEYENALADHEKNNYNHMGPMSTHYCRFQAQSHDYFPVVEFPLTGKSMTLKGDTLKSAKRIKAGK